MIFFILEPSVFIPRGGHSRTFQLGGMKKQEKKKRKNGEKKLGPDSIHIIAHTALSQQCPAREPCNGTVQRHQQASSTAHIPLQQQHPAAAGPACPLQSAHTTPTAAPSSRPCSGTPDARSKAHTPLWQRQPLQAAPQRLCSGTLQRRPAAAPGCPPQSAHSTDSSAFKQRHPAASGTSMPAPNRTHHSDSSTLKQHPAAAAACRPQSAHTTDSNTFKQWHPAASGTSMPAPKRTHQSTAAPSFSTRTLQRHQHARSKARTHTSDSSTLKQHPAAAPACPKRRHATPPILEVRTPIASLSGDKASKDAKASPIGRAATPKFKPRSPWSRRKQVDPELFLHLERPSLHRKIGNPCPRRCWWKCFMEKITGMMCFLARCSRMQPLH